MINRRRLITGLISFAAAPAIVRYNSLMPVKRMEYESIFNINQLTIGTGRTLIWLDGDGNFHERKITDDEYYDTRKEASLRKGFD